MPCGWNPLEFSGGEENWRAQATQVFRFDHHCTWLGCFFFSGLASRALRCPKKGWIVEVDFVVSSCYVSYVCMNGTLLQLLSSLSGIGKISLRWMLTYQWRQSFGVTYVWLCGKCGRKEQIKCFHIKRGLLHLFSRVDCRCSFHKIGLSVYLLDMNIYIYCQLIYMFIYCLKTDDDYPPLLCHRQLCGPGQLPSLVYMSQGEWFDGERLGFLSYRHIILSVLLYPQLITIHELR